MFYDCSPVLGPGLPVWPGDRGLTRRVSCDMKEGAKFTLSSIETTVHLGSHADAPSHFVRDGRAIHELPLEPFIGSARVVHVTPDHVGPDGRIAPTVLDGQTDRLPPRVLFRTDSFTYDKPYEDSFWSFAPETIDRLAELGCVLLGIDTPSVDPLNDKSLASHLRLAKHNIMNLEGLVLREVPPADYELIALPLRLEGFDGSPLRCILRR